ncbi:MAG: 5-oxoprolinase [Nitrospirae bacterium]|nr:MAG: 5-oxoprolinase [Nitrospirota bacterium]
MKFNKLEPVEQAHIFPMADQKRKWRFAVDRGGTFTDIVGIDPDGNFHSLKILSSSPQYSDASIEGIKRLLGHHASPLPEEQIEAIRFGTTVATNALLERKGGRVLLITTRGMADLLEIGYQDRPDIFSLCPKRQSRLYHQVIEVDERIAQDGTVIRALNARELREKLSRIDTACFDSVSVVFMHAWKNPLHELLCEDILYDAGINEVYLSHRSMNSIKIVTRGQSAVVDAYLGPVLQMYLKGILEEVGRIPVEFMVSSGGLKEPDELTGKEMFLSGPAGGVVSAAQVCKMLGKRGVIGFDMGGTSTDVSRYDGDFELLHETVIGGIELKTDMINIVTVASGGGSIVSFDGQRLLVGPESSGAYPGPACYGFGGPPSITDANLITGRLVPQFMPKTFGPEHNCFVNPELSLEAFRGLAEQITIATGKAVEAEEVALGALRVANEKMAMAIKEISVSKGYDVREYALLCFGGAGGQHACRVADILGIGEIIIHPLAGVFSAYGIGLSRRTERRVRTLLRALSEVSEEELNRAFDELTEEALKGLGNPKGFHTKREIDLRVKGTESYLTLSYKGLAGSIDEFQKRHRAIYGFEPESKNLELVNLRVELSKGEDFFPSFRTDKLSRVRPEPLMYQRLFTEKGWYKCPVYRRAELPEGFTASGPLIVVEEHSTTVVEPGFRLDVEKEGVLLIKREKPASSPMNIEAEDRADPVLLEVFHNLYRAVATKMGYTLRNTAHSVNMKERLDFSCALFDADGNLVANAPHIPVHLGAMADAVKALLEQRGGDIKPGDVYVTNNPYRGGTHLPDVTVIAPGFRDDGTLGFFVAARGHHADIGGTTPGSMPPESRSIDEEGVLIDNLLILRDGEFFERDFIRLLTEHPYPARNLPERLSDLKAQIAACQKGIEELRVIARQYGWDIVSAYMDYIQENASFMVKNRLYELLEGKEEFNSSFEDHLDDGTKIKLRVSIRAGENPPETLEAVFDFTGTDREHPADNLNAPLSVTRSAVLYVLRAMLNRDIPLNSGCLKPVKIIVPEGTVLNPSYPLSVASGNVETSQRVVDVLLGALGLAAASQGSMNNLLFLVEGETPYYETIGGGSGATADCNGASALQVHMTNTRITDPEVLEVRHPGVRLRRFMIRRGSGGKGLFSGGDGIIREIEFLKPAEVSVISERRNFSPYGLKGGEDGLKGVNLLRNGAGRIIRLPNRFTIRVKKGDSIIIKTPGGGGYGKAGTQADDS